MRTDVVASPIVLFADCWCRFRVSEVSEHYATIGILILPSYRRIRNLETQVTSIQTTLADLVHSIRAAVPNMSAPSPASQSHASSSGSHHAPAAVPNHPTPPQPQHPSPAQYGAPSPSLSTNSGGNAGYPNGVAGPTVDMHTTSNGHAYAAPHPRPPYRSTSTSSGRTLGYSPGPHAPHLSSPAAGGLPNHPASEGVYRSSLDPVQQQYSDHRGSLHGGIPPHENSNYHAQYPPQQQPTHPPMMPPPTSLPPFSALDVHPSTHRPQPPGIHIPNATRSPFVPPLSPRKAMLTSPTNTFKNNPTFGAGSGPHFSPQSAHPQYGSPVQHYHDQHPLHDSTNRGGGDPLSSSNVTSADSSDDEGGPSELPASGMIAPFVAIRGMADAAERVVEVSASLHTRWKFSVALFDPHTPTLPSSSQNFIWNDALTSLSLSQPHSVGP